MCCWKLFRSKYIKYQILNISVCLNACRYLPVFKKISSMDQVNFFSSFTSFLLSLFFLQIWTPLVVVFLLQPAQEPTEMWGGNGAPHSALSESDRGWERKREKGPTCPLSLKSLRNPHPPTHLHCYCVRVHTSQIHELGSSNLILAWL